MSPAPLLPPMDCSLLFNDILNFHMQNNPTLPMFIFADDQTSDHHVTEITFLEFGRAAHRIAHVLRPGRTGKEGQVVMLIANCDTIHFHAVVAGMAIAGLVPFLVSYRNSAAAVVHMMKEANCSRIVTLHHAHNGLMESIREETAGRELVIDELPTLPYAFPKLGREVETDLFTPYPGPASRPDLDSPAVYFHSSGSTGFPKPVMWSHKVQISIMAGPPMQFFRAQLLSGPIGAMSLPPFHGYGTAAQLYLPTTCLVVAAVYAPRAVSNPHAGPTIPTAENILDCVRWTKCRLLMLVPTFLEDCAASEECIEELKKLDLVMYGGGPLPEKIGDKLCGAGVAISTGYGGTEFGTPVRTRLKADIQDGEWNWMRFSDDIKIRWVPYGNETYECQVLSSESHLVAVENLPDVRGYATSDLFIKHPTRDLWKIIGRVDDVIILASGEKTVPAPMESIIGSSPMVQGAIIFGRERNQVGIIIEPRPNHSVDIHDKNAISDFKSKIWPLVEEANKAAPAFSRIFKEMILIAAPEKPMLRTPKGTIQRKATVKAYEAEIDALYNAMEVHSQSNEFAGPFAWSAAALEDWLMGHANSINHGSNIDTSTDLFSQGFDSLSVTYLRHRIIEALQNSPDSGARDAVSHITASIIFENPTIERLAARIAGLANGSRAPEDPDSIEQHITAINAMIEKYTHGLPGPTLSVNDIPRKEVRAGRVVVLLTGSTGGLGSFLLAQLIQNPVVDSIYAFNRPSSDSSAERQQRAFVDKGLSIVLLRSDKLVYVEADASQDKCGLSSALYEELRNTVTIIIHNAWRLDFNLSLSSFEPNVKATRNLVDLALDSYHSHSVRFVFTSSVGSAQSWDRERGAVPEEIQFDPRVAVGSGYGESKYVCERIITKSGLRATSLRIGQIAGGPNGSWAKTDWVPILVKSSIVLGAFPDSPGVVSWMRAQDVAAAVLDITFAENVPPALNIVNPQRPRWTEIMTSIRDAVLERLLPSPTREHLRIIPFADWIAILDRRADSVTLEDFVHIPAMKLLAFFRAMATDEKVTQIQTELELGSHQVQIGEAGGIANFSTTKAQRISRTVAQMQPVGDVDVCAWIEYWSFEGLF